jgi:uncharacterized protein (TIGR02147 family)
MNSTRNLTTQTRDSVSLLKEAFDKKAKANPRFSLRAFAKLLGISPAGLSQILSRKKRLSLDRAHEFARRLNLDAQERELFLTLIEAEASKSEPRKIELYEKLNSIQGSSNTHNLTVDQFRLLSSWSGFAILEMITVSDPTATNSEIARRLQIPPAEVDATLERLERLELIERSQAPKGPRYRRVEETVLAISSQSHDAFRKYYQELLAKAEVSLTEQTPQERVSGAQVFALDPSMLAEVRKLTNQYLDQLNALAQKGKRRTEIYQAFTHVFRLTEGGKPTRRQSS